MKKLFLTLALLLAVKSAYAVSFDIACEVRGKHIERHVQGDALSYKIEQDDMAITVDVELLKSGVAGCECRIFCNGALELHPYLIIRDSQEASAEILLHTLEGDFVDKRISITNFKK